MKEDIVYNKGIGAYQNTQVLTADPGRLILMCYEGAILQLKIAKTKYRERDYEGKARALKKAMDIIEELLGSLDYEKGGAIARNLQSLYKYMIKRILLADVGRDLAGLDEVMGILADLLSAWKEIIIGPSQTIQPETVRFTEERRQSVANYIRA